MSTGQFLLSLLCEEIPANALPAAREQLASGFRTELAAEGFGELEVISLSTVLRLVVFVSGLPGRQPDREEEVLGPPLRAAYTGDGAPTQAALGFARALGVPVEALRIAKGPKGEVVAGTRTLSGRPTPEVLAEIARRVVTGLHFPKTMRWGEGEHTFVRPVHNIVALWGNGELTTVVPLELFGVTARGSTSGHRVVSPGRIDVRGTKGLKGFVALLERAGVVLEPAERRRSLETRAIELAAEVGCTVRPDPDLVAEHVELVEFPGVIRGTIESRFLELPEEVLITTLRHHQKCLVLMKDGKVAPYFLAVSDRPDDPEGLVVQGNEWVAGARLADASFFFAQDRKHPLASRAVQLERVVFHQKLGSFAVKTSAVRRLAVELAANARIDAPAEVVERAASLIKVDLVTAMVGEFPELQGVMGGIYAALDGEPREVAEAIADQYTPAGLEGPLPRDPIGAVVGVADRLASLAGLFAVGEVPSGSRDPFALRRATLAVVRVCAEMPLQISLLVALERALEPWAVHTGGDTASVKDALDAFVLERERYYLTTVVGVAGDVADAVLTAHWGVVADDVARARALQTVRQEPVFADLATVFKRVRNIVARGGKGHAAPELLSVPAEVELARLLAGVERDADAALAAGDHGAGLRALATLAAPLDRFFTDVLVITDDESLRAARLALLARVETLFLRLADLSRLSA